MINIHIFSRKIGKTIASIQQLKAAIDREEDELERGIHSAATPEFQSQIQQDVQLQWMQAGYTEDQFLDCLRRWQAFNLSHFETMHALSIVCKASLAVGIHASKTSEAILTIMQKTPAPPANESNIRKQFGQAVANAASEAIDRDMIRLGKEAPQPIAERILAQVQRNKDHRRSTSAIRYNASKAFDLIGKVMKDGTLSPSQAMTQIAAITEQTIFPAQKTQDASQEACD